MRHRTLVNADADPRAYYRAETAKAQCLAVLERPKETEPIYIGLLSHSAVPMRDMNVSYVLGMRIPGCLISTARTTGGHLPM